MFENVEKNKSTRSEQRMKSRDISPSVGSENSAWYFNQNELKQTNKKYV